MTDRRVAVTGIGIICSLGRGKEACWKKLAAGQPGIGPLPSDLDFPGQVRIDRGAVVDPFEPLDHLDRPTVQMTDRFAQFALIAAEECIEDAGLDLTDDERLSAAVITGSCVGGQTTEDNAFRRFYTEGGKRAHPLTLPKIMANAGASMISMRYGLSGPSYTVSTACSSASHALGQAFWMVREGKTNIALAGGSEAPFSYGNLKAWEAMRVVSHDTCRPFSADRTGMILGEGAAIFALEDYDRARSRGAKIHAEVVGFGMNADSHHITEPSVDGPARAMRSALDDGGLEPADVGYINAHGTGTPANDPIETAAIRRLFGSHADRLAVSSTKSMHGHALGAAGALEAFATVRALAEGFLPPTANYNIPDPECDLDVIPNTGREAEVAVALSNSFAFGGLNAVVAFRRAS